jgi:hypothetical protein
MFVSQLLEKNQQNLEFPKYHIVTPPPPPDNSGNFWRAGTKLPGCVGGCDTPNIYLIGYICTISSGEF